MPFKTRYLILSAFAFAFVLFGFLNDPPAVIMRGLISIIREPDLLITDYIVAGGMGAAFVNAGLLMLSSLFILYRMRLHLNGISVAAVFLMGGFGLFGKNIFNIWLIVVGVWLYALYRREPLRQYIHIALFGTSMSPFVSEFLLIVDLPVWVRIPLGVLIGLSIGFLLPPLSTYMFRVHQGFSLYNIGFTAGLLGTVYVSIFKSYGFIPYSKLLWSTGNDLVLGIFLSLLFIALFLAGLLYGNRPLPRLKRLFLQPGRLTSDFIVMEGFDTALCNMSLNGFAAMAYVLLAGGPLNGPTVGGILTVAGFGAFGKHIRNIFPIFLGVLLGSLTKSWNANDPSILLAALFGTSLAPIAGHYGFFYGVAAGFFNSSVVLSLSALHGGMNLYNTGFSAGIVAAVMIPLIEAFRKKAPRHTHPAHEEAAETAHAPNDASP